MDSLAFGKRLLDHARHLEAQRPIQDRILNNLMQRNMEDEAFQVRSLRFVDVLPALTEDEELLHHLREYFGDGDLPLPGIAKWGLAHADSGFTPGLMAGAVRKLAEILAKRFLSGTSGEEMAAVLKGLHAKGLGGTVDRLGEAVISEAEADAYLAEAVAVCGQLGTLVERRDKLPAPRILVPDLSIKVSSLYSRIIPVDLDGTVEGVLSRLRPLLRSAREQGLSACLDMEHYELKDITLEAFRRLLMEEEFRNWPDAGIAMQAYLRETRDDIATMIEWAKGRDAPISVRLVRGAYWDQEVILARQQGWPIPVWTSKDATDRSYEACLKLLFTNRRWVRPVVASHNIRSVAKSMSLADEHGMAPEELEFQMLHGMGDALHTAVSEMGYAMRIYLPYGELLPGMAYLVRRLLENSSSQSFLSMGTVPEGKPEELLAPPPSGVEQSGSMPIKGFRNEPLHRFTDEAERSAFAAAIVKAREDLEEIYPLVIGGRELLPKRYIISTNPARTKEVIGKVGMAGEAECDAAVEAAREALPAWRELGMEARAAKLEQVAGLLAGRRDEFAAWQILEAGKSWQEADADVAEAIDFLRYYAEQARHLGRRQGSELPGESNRWVYVPRGVGAIIPPWNFPLAILTGMLSAAVVCGNTAVLKPSSQTPVTAARFMDLLREAKLLKGVVNFLPGPGAEVGERLVTHPHVDFISFTGSMEVGLRITELAARHAQGQRHVKRVIAEMGGKNAIIVDSDANLDDAIPGVIHSAFGFQGQKCSACSRVIVVGQIYETFLKRLVEATKGLIVGMPEEPATRMGPVIEAAARERILNAIEEARAHARLLLDTDVSRLDSGLFVGPTLFADVDPKSPLAQNEIFGPVLALFHAVDFDHALEIANDTRYALTGGLYTRSPDHLETAQSRFQVGNLYLNRSITGARVGHQPFGGFRLSGIGNKAGGPNYLLQFLQARTITENTLRRGFAPTVE